MKNGIGGGYGTRVGLHYVVCGSYSAGSGGFRGKLGGVW